MRAVMLPLVNAFVLTACLMAAPTGPVPAGKTIEIEFPTELELSDQPKPALLRARWVRGPQAEDDADGPLLVPWVSQGSVVNWRRLPGSTMFEGQWRPPAPAVRGTLLVVVATDARGKLEWTAQAVDLAVETSLALPVEPKQNYRLQRYGDLIRSGIGPRASPLLQSDWTALDLFVGKEKEDRRVVALPAARHDVLGLVCPRTVLQPNEKITVASASDGSVTGPITWTASQGTLQSEGLRAQYTAPKAISGDELLVVIANSRDAGSARCSFRLVNVATPTKQ